MGEMSDYEREKAERKARRDELFARYIKVFAKHIDQKELSDFMLLFLYVLMMRFDQNGLGRIQAQINVYIAFHQALELHRRGVRIEKSERWMLGRLPTELYYESRGGWPLLDWERDLIDGFTTPAEQMEGWERWRRIEKHLGTILLGTANDNQNDNDNA